MSPERLETEPLADLPVGNGVSSAPPTAWSPIRRAAVTKVVADVLEATGLLGDDQLRRVRERAGEGSVARALLDEGLAAGEAVARSLARRYGLPLVDLASTGIAPAAAKLVPLYVLERVQAIPYELEDDLLRVAIADPLNVHGIDELRLATRYQLELGVASRDDIVSEVDRLARSAEAFGARFEDIEVVEEESELDIDDGVSDAPLVRLVNSIIFQAAEEGASDIHFEPGEDVLTVRSRVDGVLREAQRVPKALANGVTTRLKVLAKLDIAERRQPQDGRMSLNAAAAGRMLDIRVATLPTVEGEAVTMRLIDKSRKIPTLESIGLEPEMQRTLQVVLPKPTGALVVTGPTGSGKSTTLYAALNLIHRPEIKTITVEDPVEYRLAGVNQIQINVKAGLTFASALRTILRSDPDVIMVGEIRDLETARISIEAALTGHFVLSTLHTNDAPSTISRLNEMGVEPFLTGSALSAVLAQRLVRRLCAFCREEYEPTSEELSQAALPPDARAKIESQPLFRKIGCSRCGRSGYRGRIAIFQLMVMTEKIERLGTERASSDDLERAAIEGGMRRLWEDGLDKAIGGLTSLEELTRVLA